VQPAPYEVLVGPGALARLPETLSRACPAARYAVIADAAVAARYGTRVRELAGRVAPCSVFTFPAGEWNKTREQWAGLSDALLAAGLGRDGAVIALGGGVTGDLAGFVAATYLRGIPYVQVPTTVLAMIDSSVGGKTGVDTPHGKNLVGAFHQPRAVVADVDTLETLPPPHLAAGLAEAFKHGAIADAAYFARLRSLREALLAHDPAAWLDAVSRSVEIKAAVVAEDEREQGRRAVLNFGHTVAHAIEARSGYETLHGEAVAIGMAAESRLGERVGITRAGVAASVVESLKAFGLPTELPVPASELIRAMSYDKKGRAGTVRFALLERLGCAACGPGGEWTFEVALEALEGPA
jgi:3-dehydroquinate synthase